MSILATTITTLATRPRPRGLYITVVPDADRPDSPRTIYRAWRDDRAIGSTWRQPNGRWTALSYRRGRAKLGFGTAAAAARWLDSIR